MRDSLNLLASALSDLELRVFETLSKAWGTTLSKYQDALVSENVKERKRHSLNKKRRTSTSGKKVHLTSSTVEPTTSDDGSSSHPMKVENLQLQEDTNITRGLASVSSDMDFDEYESLSKYEHYQFPMKGHTSYLLVAVSPSRQLQTLQ